MRIRVTFDFETADPVDLSDVLDRAQQYGEEWCDDLDGRDATATLDEGTGVTVSEGTD